MKTYLITCTGGRPEALALCDHYMGRQTDRDFEWIVVDDGIEAERPRHCDTWIRRTPTWIPGGPHTLCENLLAAFEHVTEPGLVLIVEDDDWYHPKYVEFVKHWASSEPKTTLLFGESFTRYYNVRWRTFQRNDNAHHASMCAMTFRTEFLPTLRDIVERANRNEPFIDVTAYTEYREYARLLPMHLVCGIKGLPGRPGIGVGHSESWKTCYRDPWLETLRAWIGDDVERYRDYYRAEELVNTPIPDAQKGDRWALQHMGMQPGGPKRCRLFFQPGAEPNLVPFADGALSNGYRCTMEDVGDRRPEQNPPDADLVALSGGLPRWAGYNQALFDWYRARGVPVVICEFGRVMPRVQRLSINGENWLPPLGGPWWDESRAERFGLVPEYKARGDEILVVGQRWDLDNELAPAIEAMREASEREIVFRPHPNTYNPHERPYYSVPYDRREVGGVGISEESERTLEAALDRAWCVVTHSSIVGAQALLRGIPVVSSDLALFSYVGSPSIIFEAAHLVDEFIEPDPELVTDFAERWAHTLWRESEIATGLAYRFLEPYLGGDDG